MGTRRDDIRTVGGVLGDAVCSGGVQNAADVLSYRLLETGGNSLLGVSRDRESPNRDGILVLVVGVEYRAILDGVEGDRVAFKSDLFAERSRGLGDFAESMGFRWSI